VVAARPAVVAEVIVAFVGPVLLAEYMSPLESRGSPATGVRLMLHRWRRSRRVAPSSIRVERAHAAGILR
jgi:hypothetical protein